MKKTLIFIAMLFALATTSAYAADISIHSDKGAGKVRAVKLDDGTVGIDVTAKLTEGGAVVANEYVTVAMYGTEAPENSYHEKNIGGKKYYSYYVDQAVTDRNGEIDFSFSVKVKEIQKCYLLLRNEETESVFEIAIELPPVETQDIKPMDKPSSGGGGGGGGGGGMLLSPPSQATPDTQVTPSVQESQNTGIFKDIASTHWAYVYCADLCNRGIIEGYEDGTIRPSDNITREEILATISRAFGISNSDEGITIDATSSQWALGYITAAVKNGILTEDKDGAYRGKDIATRAEVVTMLNRCLKLTPAGDVLTGFNDYQEIPEYSKDSFTVLVNKKIINGYEDNTLKPNNNITRAEFFKMISTILKEELL